MSLRTRIGERLCRFKIHRWSEPHGGIRVCERDGCQAASLYGITGAMRKIQWQKDLYQEYQRGRDP